MIAFIFGVAVGTFIGIVIMAAMNAASWDDREREYRNMCTEGKDGSQYEYESD